MQSANLFLKFLWFLSLLLFLSALFYGYYLLPDVVCVQFGSNGSPLEYWERKYVFYVFVFSFALFNGVLLILEKFFSLLPATKKSIFQRDFWLGNSETKEILGLLISNWFYSFLILLNISILISFGVIWKVNYDMQSNILQYSWAFWVISGTLFLWILCLPIRLSIPKLFIR
jgi:hypothetical protein